MSRSGERLGAGGQELDARDRKILWLLSVNSRQSFSAIARKVGASKEVVNYRVRRLLDSGVIKKFYALVDPSAMGFLTARFFIKFQQTTLEKKRELLEYYTRSPFTGWTVSRSGEYDMGAQFWGRSTAELYRVKSDILRKFKRHIYSSQVGVYHRVHFFDKKYLVKDRGERLHVFICGSEKRELDALDFRMMQLLSEDARMPLVEIAKRAGTNSSVANYKLKRLLREGAIKAFMPMIDFRKLGLEWYKITLTLEDYSVVPRMLKFASEHPQITTAYEMLAGGDFEIEVEVSSPAEIEKITDELTSKFPDAIRNYDYYLFTSEHKALSMPNPFLGKGGGTG